MTYMCKVQRGCNLSIKRVCCKNWITPSSLLPLTGLTFVFFLLNCNQLDEGDMPSSQWDIKEDGPQTGLAWQAIIIMSLAFRGILSSLNNFLIFALRFELGLDVSRFYFCQNPRGKNCLVPLEQGSTVTSGERYLFYCFSWQKQGL